MKLRKYSQFGSIQELMQGRKQQFEKLHYLLENKSSFDEIENQVESINIRHGWFSKDRKLIINSLFK